MNRDIIKDSIFIQIAACEERFIELTVMSALSNAKNPDNVYFGIFNNIIKREHSLLDNDFITKNPKIFYAEIVTPSAMGVGFGRMNASLLQFDLFDYSFQIDSHMLFTKNWDEQLIKLFNKIKSENDIEEDKIVLSATSSFSWSFKKNESSTKDNIDLIVVDRVTGDVKVIDDPLNLEKLFDEKIQWGNSQNKFVYDGKQNNVIIKDSVGFPVVYGGNQIILSEKDYLETNCVHATFMFSKASLARDILHDPQDTFHGDQTNYSVRLLSRGYRIFSPAYPVLASLDKFIIEDEKILTVDEEYNWRSCKDPNSIDPKITISKANYLKTKNWLSYIFWNKLISGEYYGYWGTPNEESLNKVKRNIQYEPRE